MLSRSPQRGPHATVQGEAQRGPQRGRPSIYGTASHVRSHTSRLQAPSVAVSPSARHLSMLPHDEARLTLILTRTRLSTLPPDEATP